MALSTVKGSVSQLPNDNFLINGNFDFWQRGIEFTGQTYCADRWLASTQNHTRTTTQQAFTIGQTEVPGEPKFFCRSVIVPSGTSNSYCILRQRIEDVRTLAGKTATLSFWAKADAIMDIAVEFEQHSPSTSDHLDAIGVARITLSTSWNRYTVICDIPSIAGFDPGDVSYISANFWLSGDSTYDSRTDSLGEQSGTFDIAQVKLEEGQYATPFVARHLCFEEILCKRYYEKSFGPDITPQNYTAANNIYDNVNSSSLGKSVAISGIGAACGQVAFSVSKRVRPTIAFYGNSSGQWINETQTGISLAVYSTIGNGLSAFTPVNTVGTTWNYLRGHWTADAEL